MFFKKKNKGGKDGYAKYAEGVNVDVMTEDGSYKLDLDALNGPAPAAKPDQSALELVRLYVISRDNIKLEDAQQIVLSTNDWRLMSKAVPLVWCAAYPDEMFGKSSLTELLLGYARMQEGEKYLNENSKMVKFEGKFKGYDYLVLALLG